MELYQYLTEILNIKVCDRLFSFQEAFLWCLKLIKRFINVYSLDQIQRDLIRMLEGPTVICAIVFTGSCEKTIFRGVCLRI